MAYKMIILALCVAGALGSAIPHAAQYPAGVSPHTCPNYPYCDNVALAHGHVAPYAAPVYAAYGVHGAVAHAAARYPAGVSPHACPNYPFCGPTPAHAVAAHGAWAGGHGDHDDGSYRPWEYETPYAHYDDGQYHHWDHAGHHW
ncbi:uncharacterized protein LOC124169404 [Ischnura elegans]|uniref:uncharacterized protein LOC124169404 n=1 Tax=Ischnura elegans TaxID=197161 RepID=UPI001ED8A2CF|nr:uncharacterized protein LOC124169404 [Ischnura elegans]